VLALAAGQVLPPLIGLAVWLAVFPDSSQVSTYYVALLVRDELSGPRPTGAEPVCGGARHRRDRDARPAEHAAADRRRADWLVAMASGVTVALVFIALALVLLRRGLRRYTGATS
jgi:ABC-type uncharacterized transport system permease subunit